MEPVVVLQDLYSGMTHSDKSKPHKVRDYLKSKEKPQQQPDIIKPAAVALPQEPEKYWEERPENKGTPKWYRWQKKLKERERSRQGYLRRKAELERKSWEELTEKEKIARTKSEQWKMKNLMKEQKEKEDRENARKRVARSRLRARLEEQYYMSKLEQGLSMEEAHMIGSLNEGNADPNKRDADIANLDKKILESFKRHKKNIEKLRNERHEMEKQRLRDRLEQEYYNSRDKTENSQGGTVQEAAPSGAQSSDVQVVGTGQEFVIVKQEDSGESSDSESSDSNSDSRVQRPQRESSDSQNTESSQRPDIEITEHAEGGMDMGKKKIEVPQTSSTVFENYLCEYNAGSSNRVHNADSYTVNVSEHGVVKEATQSNETNVENLQTDSETEAVETNDMEPILKKELLN